MRRIDIKNVPEELYIALLNAGASRRESLPATVLRLCSDSVFGPTGDGRKSDVGRKIFRPETESGKFEVPSREEAGEWYRFKSYHFDLEEWFAYYEARGWVPKGSTKATKSWKALMVTWERNWKVRQEEKGNGRKLNYAEQRIEDNLRAYDELFGHRQRAVDRPEGTDAGGTVQRTNAETAIVPVRRAAR